LLTWSAFYPPVFVREGARGLGRRSQALRATGLEFPKE
jgi:hypothetical protein